MPYLNLDLDYFTHPKVVRLVALTGPESVALPIRLWCYVGKYHCATGLLEGYENSELEALLKWTGEPGGMVDVLLKIRLLEKTKSGYRVHDWVDHAGHLVAFKKRSKLANQTRWKDLKNAIPASRSTRLAKARKKGTHTKNEWEAMKAYFDYICVRCYETTLPVEKDHIIPLYLGGSDSIKNIQPVCAKCNASKTGDVCDYRITYLIHTGKATNEDESKRLLECLLDASLTAPPILTNPSLTKPTKPSSVRATRLEALESFSITKEMAEWADQEFHIDIPGDVLGEFKNYWREKKQLYTDWDSTFKNRIRQLISLGILKPKAAPGQVNRPPYPPPKTDPIARGQWKKVYGDPKDYGYD